MRDQSRRIKKVETTLGLDRDLMPNVVVLGDKDSGLPENVRDRPDYKRYIRRHPTTKLVLLLE